jgi:hypothetical protein
MVLLRRVELQAMLDMRLGSGQLATMEGRGPQSVMRLEQVDGIVTLPGDGQQLLT